MCLSQILKHLLLVFTASASCFADEFSPLVRLSEPTKNARLVSITKEGAEFLDSIMRSETFSYDQLVRWGSLTEREQSDQVKLVDGSTLVGSVTRISRAQVVVETDVWGELTLSRDLVSTVVWRLPSEPTERTKFRDLLSKPLKSRGATEKLMLRGGDFRLGSLIETDDRQIKFQTEVGEIDLRLDLVSAWRAKSEGGNLGAGHVLGFRDGTKLFVSEMRVNQQIEADLQCGLHIGSLPEIRAIDERLITYVRFDNPDVKYLSDVAPLGHKHIPFLTSSFDWGRDRNVLGGQISSDRHTFDKGIGMHSTSRLAYDLPKGFDEFQAEICIDRSAGQGGSVVFRVFASRDGAKWGQAFKSDIVRGGDRPSLVRVDIREMKRLALVVDFAERGDQLDRANWIGARLVRR